MNEKSAYTLREIFQRIELDLIASMKRNFLRHKKDELDEGFQWEQWQLVKLRNLVKYRKANKDIIGEYSKTIENTINEILQESFQAGQDNVDMSINSLKNITAEISLPEDTITPLLNKQPLTVDIKQPETSDVTPIKDVLDNVLSKPPLPKAPPEESFFGVNEKKLKALQDSVNDDLKNAQQAILRQMDDVYKQTLYKTHIYLHSGATSLNKAIDMATKDFLDKGINCIVYKDGKRANIASYAEMELRTASQRATFLGEGRKRDEWGIHTVVVSAHANTCKLCLPWQGKVLIDDVYCHGSKTDGDYPLLSEAMKAGLLHPNCRHTLATYFPGITRLPKVPDDKEALKNYKAEQQQRYMERQIRKWKRIEAGSLSSYNQEKASERVEEWEDKLKQHIGFNSELRRESWREQNKDDTPLTESEKMDNIKIDSKQFGKKVGKHAEDYGLDVSKNEEREKMNKIINNIIENHEEVRKGTWRGLGGIDPATHKTLDGEAWFLRKGNDVVVVNSRNQFVTILKNGVNNERFKSAKIKGKR